MFKVSEEKEGAFKFETLDGERRLCAALARRGEHRWSELVPFVVQEGHFGGSKCQFQMEPFAWGR